MVSLIKSLARSYLAMSLLGIQQLRYSVSSNAVEDQEARGMDSGSSTGEPQFEKKTTGHLQRGWADMALNALGWEAFTPRGVLKLSFVLMQQSVEAMKPFVPGRQNRLAWQEFQNKLQAFYLFEHADSILRLPFNTYVPLDELMNRVSTLEPFLAVWVAEGVGHHYADSCWKHNGTPRNLLNAEQSAKLAPSLMTPLHTGMGLSFADAALRSVDLQNRSGAGIAEAVQSFVRLCRTNSQAGYVCAAYESLGLVARNLYPQTVNAIDHLLTEIDPELAAYFWHGVGRAIYFAPTRFLPDSSTFWQAVEISQREPPHMLGRLNALAGLAWALTLVNIRQPQIIEDLFRRYGDQLVASGGFSNGVCSSIMIWYDSAPTDPFLSAFREYKPDSSDSRAKSFWEEYVRRPCEDALRHYDLVKGQDRIGELFCYRLLPEWFHELENNEHRNGESHANRTRVNAENFRLAPR
jgi:hypothetical protein